MTAEGTSTYIATPLASGWITCAPGDSYNETAYQEAISRGFIEIDAQVIARMSYTARLPSLSALQAPQDVAFQPLLEKNMGLYVIVDSSDWVQRVLQAGVQTVQLRIKASRQQKLRDEIKRSIALARDYQAQLFINDHWQLALAEGAYGIHIGQEDLRAIGRQGLTAIAQAGVRLGISTHAYFEVCRALTLHPSYIAAGPIHPTAVKAMPWIPQGNDNLAYWCSKTNVPVVAIAGMDAQRATEATQCGAAGVAVISAVTAAADPEGVIRELKAAIALGKTLSPWPVPQLAHPTLRA